MNQDTRNVADLLRKCGFQVIMLQNHQKPQRLNQDGTVHSFPLEEEVIGDATDTAANALEEFALMFEWFPNAVVTLRVVSVYMKNGKHWASGMCALYEQPGWDDANSHSNSRT